MDDYNKIFNHQNGVCAICHKPETKICKKTNKPFMLSVDHIHESGKVRGLLCGNCNNGLGRFKDSIQSLENAINYLNLRNK